VNLFRRLLRTRLFRTVAVILVLVAVWQVFLSVSAPGKIDPALEAEVQRGEPLRVEVTLNFPPERFHTLTLQDYGRVMGVEDDSVLLRDVRPSSVGLLARIYWVDRLSPVEEGS
jgi:hypothetical protein